MSTSCRWVVVLLYVGVFTSQMIAGGADPLAVAAYLYGVELDTGKLSGKKVPLCSMEPGPKTNPQQCPWSIELA